MNDISMTLPVKQSDTIGYVKKLVYERTQVLPKYMVLRFGGEVLQDDKELRFYNIQSNNTLHMLGRLLGGKVVAFLCKFSESVED